MIIGIDLRPLNTGWKSGVEVYTIHLLKHLFLIDQKNKYKLFVNSFLEPKLNFTKLNRLKNVEIYSFFYPNKILNSSLSFLRYPKIDRMLKGVDVFFSPNIIFTRLTKSCKHVITFHDLSFQRHPEFFSWERRIWHKFVLPQKQALEASKIIAVSESTRNDLIKLYKLKPTQIEVVYSGILSKFKKRKPEHPELKRVREKYNLPSHFLLYLGTIEPRKNVEGLILAFNKFKKRNRNNIKLVVCGKPGWLYKDVYKLASQSPYYRDIMFTGFIPSEDKPYLYNLAEIFVYPSFYEGFGFPPLEAMASGTPLISSNISSLPEVVGNSGLLIDPNNINELAEALRLLSTDLKLREYFSMLGSKRAPIFQWTKTAQKTLDIFENI